MFSQVVSYSGTLPRVTKQNSKEGLSRDCRDKGRLEVHVLLGLFADERIQTFHVRSEGRVGLPFLFLDESSGGNYNACPWYNACAVEHDFIVLRTGCVGNPFFPTDRPNEKRLLVFIQIQRAQKLGDGPLSRVFFMGNAKPQVGGDCEPGKQECKRPCLASTKDSSNGQRGSARLQS